MPEPVHSGTCHQCHRGYRANRSKQPVLLKPCGHHIFCDKHAPASSSDCPVCTQRCCCKREPDCTEPAPHECCRVMQDKRNRRKEQGVKGQPTGPGAMEIDDAPDIPHLPMPVSHAAVTSPLPRWFDMPPSHQPYATMRAFLLSRNARTNWHIYQGKMLFPGDTHLVQLMGADHFDRLDLEQQEVLVMLDTCTLVDHYLLRAIAKSKPEPIGAYYLEAVSGHHYSPRTKHPPLALFQSVWSSMPRLLLWAAQRLMLPIDPTSVAPFTEGEVEAFFEKFPYLGCCFVATLGRKNKRPAREEPWIRIYHMVFQHMCASAPQMVSLETLLHHVMPQLNGSSSFPLLYPPPPPCTVAPPARGRPLAPLPSVLGKLAMLDDHCKTELLLSVIHGRIDATLARFLRSKALSNELVVALSGFHESTEVWSCVGQELRSQVEFELRSLVVSGRVGQLREVQSDLLRPPSSDSNGVTSSVCHDLDSVFHTPIDWPYILDFLVSMPPSTAIPSIDPATYTKMLPVVLERCRKQVAECDGRGQIYRWTEYYLQQRVREEVQGRPSKHPELEPIMQRQEQLYNERYPGKVNEYRATQPRDRQEQKEWFAPPVASSGRRLTGSLNLTRQLELENEADGTGPDDGLLRLLQDWAIGKV